MLSTPTLSYPRCAKRSENSKSGSKQNATSSKSTQTEKTMDDTNQFTNKNLIAMMRKDCRAQAEAAEIKLSQVIDCLSDENHLRALGAFVGLDEDMARLRTFLVHMARLEQ